MKNNTNFPIRITWDEQEQEFFAEIPALDGCQAYGKTEAAALKELRIAKKLWLDARAVAGLPIPRPEASVEKLRSMRTFVNMSKIARAVHIPEQTLISKIKRGTPLSQTEGERIGELLATLAV